MCDFNNYEIINIQTNEVLDSSIVGHYGAFIDINYPIKPGLYHIGMSGCAKYYYDGELWYDPWKENDKYKFNVISNGLTFGELTWKENTPIEMEPPLQPPSFSQNSF